MNREQMRADAEAVARIEHCEHPAWYDAGFFMGADAGFEKNAIHIANCSPKNLLKLLAVVEAADNYYRRYAQDEASEDGCEVTGCTLSQHEDAVALRDALTALEAP